MNFQVDDLNTGKAVNTEETQNNECQNVQEYERIINKSPEWPELADEAFHGLAGDIVKEIDPHTEADPVALLIQFLLVFGSLVGRGPHFIAEADQHFTNLFCCLVGETSKGKKGSSWGHVIRLFQCFSPDWIRDCIHSGLSSGEGLIWGVRDEIKKTEPIKKSGIVTDYQEVVVDPGIDDKRALVVESEFASPLRIMERDGNTLSAVLRNAWDSKDLKIMTKNSPAKATEPHISIIGHITRAELTRYLNSTECGNGFANRFLWACVRRSKVLPEGGKIHEVNFGPLIKRLKDVVNFSRTVEEMKRDDGARRLWREVYPELSEGKPGLLGAVVARAEAQTMRLACLYALLDLSPVIRVEHLTGALAIWTYCEQSARYIFGDSLGDPDADLVKQALDENLDGLTRTEISNLFSRNKSSSQIQRILDLLIRNGSVYSTMEDSDGKRPIEHWFSMRHRVRI